MSAPAVPVLPDALADAIAVVGMAGRFPGAPDLAAFWRNLREGRESIQCFSPEELVAAGVPAALVADPDYVRAKGVIDDADTFDAAFFGYLPSDVEIMDPQHRLFLECAWAALEDAGYDPLAAPGLVGVFGGMSQSTYLPLLRAADPEGTRYGAYPLRLGTDKDYLTTRVSYKLNLRGPSMNVQTACSTSLVAVCQACQSLLAYQSDMALAGGVAVGVPLRAGHHYHEGGIFSPDGHCRPFDVKAQGTVNGDGVGLVVLKRLADAVADGDTIRAVIRGSALNNDGAAKMSFPAPSPDGQAEAIATALAVANVPPESIGYVEAHGTGTPLGDPIEIAGLTRAFRAGTDRTGFCAIGSVKGNIGHTDTAAGVAGLIKTVLALEHRELPPTLHYSAPNAAIDFAATPFVVAAERRDWPAGPTPRRAGVSAFGLGGTNAHVVLEEAPDRPRDGADAASTLLVLSAKTPTALDAATVRLADALEASPGRPLRDVAFTLRAGRHPFVWRRAVVASGTADAVRALRSADPRVAPALEATAAPAAFMFPGGGAQYVGMARGLAADAPVFRDTLAQCLALVTDRDLAAAIWPAADDAAAAARLEAPSWGLPALFAVEYALARQLMAWGVEPVALIGHSMGEYTAACLAGVMTLADAMRLVQLRGTLFETLPAGGMLAVPLPEADVRARLPRALSIAAINADASTVVAGDPETLAAFARALEAEDVECRRLRIAVAAHSPMVEAILEPFRRFLETIPLAAPTRPVLSNLTGTWLTAADAQSSDYWVRHLRETVRFHAGLDALLADGDRTLLEVGPGQALSTFARQHARVADARGVVASMRVPTDTSDDLAVLLQAAGRVWSRGVALDWTALPDTAGARRTPLPSYPFERQRYFPERPAVAAATTAPVTVPPRQDVAVMPSPLPVPVPVSAPPPPSRLDEIVTRLTALFQTLSGMPAGAIRRDVPFLEMGFDSLFLTQATLRIKGEFKVRVTFRQLFEDAPTIDALATFIDGKLPPAPVVAPAAPAATPMALPAVTPPQASAAPVADTVAPSFVPAPAALMPADASAIERVVQEQLRLMAEQLRLLGGTPAPAVVAAPVAHVVPVASPVAPPAATVASPSTPPQFGPFRGIDQSAHGLTPVQQRGLDDLITRYTTKTAASKALTAAQRGVLADPRAVGGFRKVWKEIVYQIATDWSQGTKVRDIDGNEYLDLTSGFGVNLFGHGVPWVADAVRAQLDRGIELGTLSPLAKDAADLIREITGMERVTFANTGSEAMSGAIRAVRTATGREWIAVFDDEYHGMSEEVLVKPVSRADRYRAAAAAPGIPDHFVDKVIVLHWNDPGSFEVLRARADEIAGVIVEPVQGRHPDFRPVEQLRELRRVTRELDIPLVYDEMITGFRLHPRGAQGYLGVDCDVACYGKIMSGGLPIAAIAGTAQYMDAFDGGPWQFGDDSFPEGGVTFFGGTFTRNALCLAAAVASLRQLRDAGPALYERLNAKAEQFAADVEATFRRHDAPMHLEHCASICSISFTDANPLARLLFHYLRLHGIHVWDRPFFVSTAHTEADLRQVVDALDTSLVEMRRAGFFGTPVQDGPSGGSADDGLVPFTEPQMEVWLGSHLTPVASAAFNEVVAKEIGGTLAVTALQGAVDDLTARHESLRMSVSTTPPGFRVASSLPLVVELFDHTQAADAAAARDEVLRRFNREPLDFVRGPLWRVGLVREPGRDVLVIAIHHLICDGWSFGVLLREIEACYEARLAGRPHTLPPAMQASAYARALAARAGDDEARDTEAWWLAQYATVPEPLNLPVDRPRPAVATFNGRRLVVTFDTDLADRVRRFATAHRTTPFSTLLAAFQVLVSRLSGQGDFVVGIPMAGQALVEAESLVAHCVSFIAVRCAVDPSTPFVRHVAAVTSRALDLNDHQQYTYLSLLHALRLPRSLSRDPLVSVSFTLEPSFADPTFAGLPASVLSVPRETSRRDLHVNVMETPAGLAVEADYNADILDASTVAHWLEAFRTSLVAALADPAQPVGALPLVTPAEFARLTAPPAVPEPLRFDPATPLAQIFEARVAATPLAPAVTCDGRTWTYAELNAAANRVAAALTARGAGPGSLVGVCLERGAALVPSLLGVLKAGAAYLPIDLAYPPERLAFMLRDAGAPLLLTQASVADRVPVTVATLVLVDDVLEATGGDDNPPAAAGPDDLAYVIYTSGTSGTPKGSMVTHRHVVSLMAGAAPLFHFGATDVWTLFHSYAFDFSVWELWGALLYGGRLVVVPQAVSRSPEAFYDLLVGERVTVLSQTPTAFRQVMAVDEARAGALSLRYVVFGGEALDMPGLAPWFDRHGDTAPTLVNGYGITETTVFVTFHTVTRADTTHQGAGVIGAPMPLWQVYLLDDRMQPVPVGARGEIYVAGAGVTAGYLNRDDLTRARFVPNPFGAGTLYKSGDGARYLENGELEYLGRLDLQVKIRGFRVELGEIETVLARHASVAGCRVLARPGAGGPTDLRLVAYVQAAGAPPDPAVLQAHLRQSVPDYMVPGVFVAVAQFPLTANGKLDERALPDPDRARLVSAGTPERAESPVEARLARLWARLLGVPGVRRTDDFFDLGGHSLLAIQLVHEVGETFGVTLAPVALFEHSRLDALAAAIEAALPAPPAPVPPAAPSVATAPSPSAALVTPATPSTRLLTRMSAGGPGAPFFWVHGVGGEIYSYMQVTKHLAAARPVYGFAADWTQAFAPADRTIERIAAAYTRELVALRPEGPYHLGGYCSAAVIVLEIARQLEAQGREVGAFTVLDYAITAGQAPAPAPLLMAFAKNLPRWIGDDAMPTGMGGLASRVRSKVRQLAPWRDDDETAARPRDIRDELGLWRFPDSKVAMLQLHLDVLRAYVPQPFDGRATLILPRTGPLLGPFPEVNDYGWRGVARGGVDIHTVPGSHSTFLNEPFASTIAAHIEANIREAEARLGELVGGGAGAARR